MDIIALGEASSHANILLVLLSAVSWELIRRVASHFLLDRFPVKDANRLAISVSSAAHSVFISVSALYFVLSQPAPDSLYVRLPLARLMYAVATGYFAWDIVVVLVLEPKIDIMFLLHAVFCFFAYLFGQYPFLNYYGVFFLLFELSTPLLHLRHFMVAYSGDSPSLAWAIAGVEVAFALVFFVVRIAVGFPMSALVWRDLLELLGREVKPDENHPTFVAVFYLVANTGLCGMNLAWFYFMVKKKFRKKRSEKKVD
jgi:hypothetical protein